MSKYSVIDLGSNSIRLMILDVEDYKIISCKKELIMTRLGKSVNEKKELSVESMEDTFKALELFSEKIKEEKSILIGAFATSAVRDSSNSKYFIEEAKKRCGIDVTIISGDEEARLGYLGVLAGISDNMLGKDDSSNKVMIIDIGGGSTEIIIGNKDGIMYSKSFDMGSVRLTEMFISNDPPLKEELSSLENYIDEYAKEIYEICEIYRPSICVGIAGTITTVGSVSLGMEEYSRERIHNLYLGVDEVQRIYNMFAKVDLRERKNMVGLQPQRADIIISGTAILKKMIEMSRMDGLVVSDYDNLEGVLVGEGILKI